MTNDLPLISSHARMDYGRCPKKWYWRWLRGLLPKQMQFGALELGEWVHLAFDVWYCLGTKRRGDLPDALTYRAYAVIERARIDGAPDNLLDKAEQQAALGQAVLRAYQKHYGSDPGVYVLATETPLEFRLGDTAVYKLKPDMVFTERSSGERRYWLMEHKTTKTIRTGHLVIDGQARPYAAMAERALKNVGILPANAELHGIMYNFLRKALSDERPTNSSGKYLNKDGSVSQKQPPPQFLRYPLRVSRKAKAITLRRVMNDAREMVSLRKSLQTREISTSDLRKTPHYSCERTCDYFTMCVTEEEGGDIRALQRSLYRRGDPYEYYADSTTEPPSFELG